MNKKVIIFSAPSGAGKSTVVGHLLKKYPFLEFSISATSRPPRGSERDGVEYYFFSEQQFRELIARVKVLLKRSAEPVVASPKQLTYADLFIDLDLMEVKRNGISIKLSPKEYNLLVYMTTNAGRVISRVEIAEKVWNTHFDTGTNFIDVYINYLRKKIDKDFEPKLIHTKPGVGFILTDAL